MTPPIMRGIRQLLLLGAALLTCTPVLAAVSVSQVGQATLDTAGSCVTNSFTREPGRHYIAIGHNYSFAASAGTLGASGWAEPSESASGGRLYNSNVNRFHVLENTVGSTTTGTVTFAITGNGGVGCTIAVLEVQGHNTSDAIRQIVFNSGTGGDPNPLQVTLAALGDATNNGVIAAWGGAGDSTFSTPTGYTETYDPGTANAAMGVFYDIASPASNPTSTNSVAFLDVAAVAIEINVASAGCATVVNPISGKGGCAAQPVISLNLQAANDSEYDQRIVANHSR